MKKTSSLTRLSLRKIRRTLFRNPLQFTAILLITILSTTLFSGLYGSVKQFENQIQTAKVKSNEADIYVGVYTGEDHSDVDTEFKNIKEIVGDKGTVETKHTTLGKLNGFENYLKLSDSYPTISKEFQVQKLTKEDIGNDFFAIDWRYYYKDFTYGTGWVDEKKNPLPINVSFDGTYFKKEYKLGDGSLLDRYLKPGKKNIFNNNLLQLSIKPTSRFKSFNNISVADSSTPDSFLSRSLFNKVLIETINDNFEIPLTPPEDPQSLKAYKLLKDPVTYVTNAVYINNTYMIKLNNSKDRKEVNNKIITYFKNKSDNNLLISEIANESSSNKIIMADINQTIALSFMFPSIFMVVSLLVVGTTFAQLILKERNDIGTLKAIGVSKKRIIINYLILGLIVCFIGCFIGIALGPSILPPLLGLKFEALYWVPKRVFIYPTLAAILSSLVFLISIGLVIFFVTRKEASLPPSFTLRPLLPKSFKSSKKVKGKYVSVYSYVSSSLINLNKNEIIKLINNGNVKINNDIVYDRKRKVNVLLDTVYLNNEIVTYKKNDRFIPLKMALRNIRCSVPKSLLVVLGIAGCTSIISAAYGIDNSLTKGAEQDLERFLSSDLNLNFSNPSENTYDKILYYRDVTNEIEEGDPYSTLPTSIYKENQTTDPFNSTVYVINPESKFIHFGNNLKLEDDKIIITKKLAQKASLKVGDKVNCNVLSMDFKGTIYAIIDTFYIQGLFISKDYITEKYESLQYYVTGAYIKVNKEKVKDTKEFGNKLVKEVDGVINFYEYKKNKEALQSSFDTLKYITTIFKIFGVCLGLVVLYNFIILTYNQRTRDIATMKVIGFNNKKLSLTLLIEILLLGVVGIIIGTSLSMPFLILLLKVNENDMLSFNPYIKPLTYLISISITLLAMVVISLVVLIKNKRIKMVESLKSVE